jgi:hypothetical protein
MSKLFIENNFIAKLYHELKYYKTVLASNSLDNMVLNKILLPFFISPISLLQEINIAFQYHKKISKVYANTHIALTLAKDSINSQLIETDYFKKNKFRGDWPYNGQVSLLNS